MTSESFLNCYIWVVGGYTEQKTETTSVKYPVKKVFKYNSSEDKTFEKANDNMTPFFEFQIPHFLIQGISEQNAIDVISGAPFYIFYNPAKNIWFVR